MTTTTLNFWPALAARRIRSVRAPAIVFLTGPEPSKDDILCMRVSLAQNTSAVLTRIDSLVCERENVRFSKALSGL